ncbi:MAG: DegT/DnrJ/EryC1/StrS family aminotransferase, partial [Phycisphaerae bacterium]|nr:DegT/DnrJ/EryC1/StrS family aminotransferase [Phycisphaerae bacterium]
MTEERAGPAANAGALVANDASDRGDAVPIEVDQMGIRCNPVRVVANRARASLVGHVQVVQGETLIGQDAGPVVASLEFWLTSGRYAREFEEKLTDFLKVKYCLLVNSGSSANLLAV